MTALHTAALRGKTEVAALLIEHGGDVNAVDKQGRNALDLAANAAFARLLVASAARPIAIPFDRDHASAGFHVIGSAAYAAGKHVEIQGADASARSIVQHDWRFPSSGLVEFNPEKDRGVSLNLDNLPIWLGDAVERVALRYSWPQTWFRDVLACRLHWVTCYIRSGQAMATYSGKYIGLAIFRYDS